MSRAMIFSCSLSFPYCTSVYIHLPRCDRHFAFLLGPQLCRVAIQCCSAAGARSFARALGTHSMHIRPLHCPWVWITVGSHTHCSPVTSGVWRLKFHTGKLWHWHVTFSISEYHIVLLQLCSESTSPSPFPLLYLIALSIGSPLHRERRDMKFNQWKKLLMADGYGKLMHSTVCPTTDEW